MITPSDIRDKSFSTTRDGGYDVKEVNAFLDSVTDSYSAVIGENKELFRKMEILANKIEEYREEEDSIKSALITAQKAADSISKQAKDGAESLIAEATQKAQQIVTDANEKAHQVTSEADQYAHGVRDENFHEAQKLIDEAEAKANEAISAAKIVAQSIVQEAKTLASELLAQAKARKDEYEKLLAGVQSETLTLKADLLALYQNQIDSLNKSVDFDVHQAADEADKAYDDVLAKVSAFEQKELDAQAEDAAEAAEPEELADTAEPAEEETAQQLLEPVQDAPEAAQAPDAPEAESTAPAADTAEPEEEVQPAPKAQAQPQAEETAAETPVEDAAPKHVGKHGSDADLFTFSMPDSAEQEQTVLSDMPQETPAPKVSPDVKSAIDAFSGSDLTPIENQKTAIGILDDEDDDDMLDTGDFTSLFASDNDIPARPTEKLSLIPPDDDDDEEDEPKFKGFFKKKR